MNLATRSTRAFTLLELLVVIALVAGLAVLVVRGFAGTSGAEMRQAESALGAQLTLARATAIRLGKPVRLAVNLDSPDLDQRLAFVVLLAQDATSGEWVLVSEPWRLGAQVRVLPESAVPAASALSWPGNVVSRWTATVSVNTAGIPAGNYGYLEFAASGGIFGNPKLAFATVTRQAAAFEFNSTDQVRCFMVRGSGVATLFKEAASIP